MPPGAGSERVVAKLGPGNPKDVLAALLNGSKFNYVILGEPNNSGAVQKVILMAASAPPPEEHPRSLRRRTITSRSPCSRRPSKPPRILTISRTSRNQKTNRCRDNPECRAPRA